MNPSGSLIVWVFHPQATNSAKEWRQWHHSFAESSDFSGIIRNKLNARKSIALSCQNVTICPAFHLEKEQACM